MKNNIRAQASTLKKALRKVSIGKGKDSGYTIAVTKKIVEGKFHKCSLICGDGSMQATAGFYVQLVRTDQIDGKEQVVKEPLESTFFINASSILREAVETLGSMEDNILITCDNTGKNLVVQNTKSTLPIPTTGPSTHMENPKDCKIINVTVDKEELISSLKLVNVALVRKGRFGNRYGFKPMVSGDTGVLHILACDEKCVSYQDVSLLGMGENYKAECENVAYAMLPADKVGQILSEAENDTIRFTFYYNDDKISAKQVNVKSDNDLYQMLTQVTCVYPPNAKTMTDEAYDVYDASFQCDVGSLKSAFQVTALGNNPSSVKSVMRISKNGVKITDESGEKVTYLKDIETTLDDSMEEVVINVVNDLIMSVLSPFNGEKVRIQGSNENCKRLISIVGGKRSMHAAIFPVVSMDKNEVIEDEPAEETDESSENTSGSEE